jgi:hypothetical protein
MKKFELTITLSTTSDIKEEDFTLDNHDVIDGFELSRTNRLGDTTSDFHLFER